MENTDDVILLADNKILLGLNLIEKLDQFKEIPGVQKIQRKIGQEIKFLKKAKISNSLVVNHVMCSNLTHYEFLVQVLSKQHDLVHLDCAFLVDNRQNPVRVDIVCDNGAKWIKVIARNPKSISDAAKGGVSFGVKSIVDQAEQYSRTAEQNLYMFKKPQVFFYFSHNIDLELLDEIHNYGIGTAINDEPLSNNTDVNSNNENSLNTKILNLDITTMIGYVSALTNGHYNWIFQESILTEQASRERETPLKPILDKLFEGKQLICCETTKNSFKEIIETLAGTTEKKRAEELLSRMDIRSDLEDIPEALCALKLCGKIKPRSLKIFAFGLANKAITVTSNEGFIRSAKMKGINIPVFIHQARALTESKETEGKLITDEF